MYLRDNIKIMVQELSKGWFEAGIANRGGGGGTTPYPPP